MMCRTIKAGNQIKCTSQRGIRILLAVVCGRDSPFVYLKMALDMSDHYSILEWMRVGGSQRARGPAKYSFEMSRLEQVA